MRTQGLRVLRSHKLSTLLQQNMFTVTPLPGTRYRSQKWANVPRCNHKTTLQRDTQVRRFSLSFRRAVAVFVVSEGWLTLVVSGPAPPPLAAAFAPAPRLLHPSSPFGSVCTAVATCITTSVPATLTPPSPLGTCARSVGRTPRQVKMADIATSHDSHDTNERESPV